MTQEEFGKIVDKVEDETFEAYIRTAKKFIESHSNGDFDKKQAIEMGVACGLLMAGSIILESNLTIGKGLGEKWALEKYNEYVKEFADRLIPRGQ